MKISKTIIIFIFIALLFTTCKEQKSQFKVGFLFSTLDSKRWYKEKEYFEEKIKEYGGTVLVKIADRDDLKQYQQALELIAEGVDIIAISVANANTATAIIRDAHKSGIKVIAYDRFIKNCELDFFITFDGEKVGELLAEFMINKVPQGNYVLLNGDIKDENAIIFQKGVFKILQPYIDSKKINLVYSGYMEDWLGINAAFYTDKIFEFSNVEINAIISTYDGLSDGIASVLKERNLTYKIPITGQDAEVAACNRIMNGEQAMTIYKPGKALAYKCAEIVIQLLKNEKIEGLKYINNGRIDVPSVVLEPIAVDKSNMESTVVADDFLSMDEIINYKDVIN